MAEQTRSAGAHGGERGKELAAMVEASRGLVRYLAHRAARRYGLVDQVAFLIACGDSAAFEAARRFDSARGVRLHTFLWPRIKGAISDECRSMCRWHSRGLRPLGRVDRQEEAGDGLFLPGLGQWVHGTDPGERSEKRNLLSTMREAIQRLSAEERHLLGETYLKERPLREVCQELGMDASWASRRRERALSRLRRLMDDGAYAGL